MGQTVGNEPGFVQDVLARAVDGTLEASGHTIWTLIFAGAGALVLWLIQCRRENRSFWSLPVGWKKTVADTASVTSAALVIVFVLKVVPAAIERDKEQRSALKDRQAAIDQLSSDLQQTRTVEAGVPIVPENPDHANLVTRLQAAENQLSIRDRELVDTKLASASKDTQIAALEARIRVMEGDVAAARQRADELQRKLGAATSQQTQCEQLASLSGAGRQLVGKLFKTRAAPETRREIDGWYEAVCAAMSKNQCEAFLSAPRARDVWANYPFQDGGYSQTLRGRTEYLSAQLARLCR